MLLLQLLLLLQLYSTLLYTALHRHYTALRQRRRRLQQPLLRPPLAAFVTAVLFGQLGISYQHSTSEGTFGDLHGRPRSFNYALTAYFSQKPKTSRMLGSRLGS